MGEIYEFDSIENASRFAQEYFPGEAKKMNAAFTTRVFDGSVTEETSRQLNSVHYR